jgi:DNA-binding LytR/AlgR family response regulator
MKIKCLIVDDEPAAREILQRYVNDDSRLEWLAGCANAFEAKTILDSEKIDLLFLDINMPKLSGLAFYKTLSNPPQVIFTTAYPEYAVDGFEVQAVDYLVKPFTFERFFKAVSKVTSKVHKKETNDKDFILLSADKKIYKVNINDIIYLEAQGDYVNVYLDDKQLLVHDTLQNLHKLLAQDQFSRIHKSYIVALAKFDYVEGNMVAIGRKFLPIGDTYRNAFLKAIKKD